MTPAGSRTALWTRLAAVLIALAIGGAAGCGARTPQTPPKPAASKPSDTFTLLDATVDKDEPPAGLEFLFAQSVITLGGTDRTGDVSTLSESLDMPFVSEAGSSTYTGKSSLRMNGTYDYTTGSFEGTYTIVIDYHRSDTSTLDPAEIDHRETVTGSVEGTAAQPGTPPSGQKIALTLTGTQAVTEHAVRKGSPASDEEWGGEWVLSVVYVVR